MQNKHHRKNLRPFLGQDVDPKDILSSHVYGSAARQSNAVPARPILQPKRNVGRGYGDSMVGSLSQYRTAPQKHTPKTDTPESASDVPITGNRTLHNSTEKGRVSTNVAERQKHFIEPPKRGFHPYA